MSPVASHQVPEELLNILAIQETLISALIGSKAKLQGDLVKIYTQRRNFIKTKVQIDEKICVFEHKTYNKTS